MEAVSVEQLVGFIIVVVQRVRTVSAPHRSESVLTRSDWLAEGSGSAGSFDLLGWSSG